MLARSHFMNNLSAETAASAMAVRVLLLSRPAPCPRCGLRKAGRRLISALDPAASGDRLLRKFVASSCKRDALDALAHLISLRLPSLALLMYRRIREAAWYRWNPKLLSEVAALLEKERRFEESETLIADSAQSLTSRDLALLYCYLIESYSKNELKEQAINCFDRIWQIPSSLPASIHRRAHASMLVGLCSLQLPQEAEKVLEAMGNQGFRPSDFELRAILLCYGRLGLFAEMHRLLDDMEELDTVTANVVLSCYGHHNELTHMVLWLRKIKNSGIDFSIRTFNSALNSCAGLIAIAQDSESRPLSMEELFLKLGTVCSAENEILLVEELNQSRVLDQNLQWSDSEAKLDLHGMHLGSAYLIVLQWVELLRLKLREGVPPLEISVVCGSGKNSTTRGESPIKKLISEMMFQMSSPLRLDRSNLGRFTARGKAVKQWLRG